MPDETQSEAVEVNDGFTRDPVAQQAAAWLAVYNTCRDLPTFRASARSHESGMNHVCRFIRELAMDTYSLQRDLMQRSNQDLPEAVCLTPQVLMYFALQMEELGETAVALADAFHNADSDDVAATVSVKQLVGFSKVADMMVEIGPMLKKYSRAMRAHIAGYFGQEQPRIALSLKRAVLIVDGGVDVGVVNAGFMLSLGTPARLCYDNVVLSNLSKTNPETGVIDKEPDGKWIKGPNYKEPTLAAVIEPLLWKPPSRSVADRHE